MEGSFVRVKGEKVEPRRQRCDQVAEEEMEDGDGATRGATAAGAPSEVTDRRLLRGRYREFKNEANERKSRLAGSDVAEFKEFVQSANSLYKHVSKPREQIRDAEVLNDITSELLVVAKNARMKGGMSAHDFVDALIHKYGIPGDEGGTQRSIDWEAFGLDASGILLPAPGMSTMVGPMDVEPKMKKVPTNVTRDRPTATTRPQEVKEPANKDQNIETDAIIKIMFDRLIALKRVPLDYLVLNPLSFPQTNENILALSFLAKDGRVEIRVSEDQKYYVAPRNAPSHAARAAAEVSNSQFVATTSISLWKLMQQAVPQGAEVMPHRPEIDFDGSAAARVTKSDRTPIRKISRNRARETPSADLATEGEDKGSRRLKRNLESFQG